MNKFVMKEYIEKKVILEDRCKSSELASLKVPRSQYLNISSVELIRKIKFPFTGNPSISKIIPYS